MNDIVELVFWGIVIFEIGAWWQLFKKAGEPGWAAIVPFYNIYVMLKVADKPGWWLPVILFVPFLSIVLWILMLVAIAQNFGKGAGYALGLIFLPFIFVPVLAFGKASYLTITGAPISQDNEIPPDQLTPITPVMSQGWRS